MDGPAHHLLAAAMAWVSGFERQRLIERVHARLERARRKAESGAPARPSYSCRRLGSWWRRYAGRSGAGEGRQPRVAVPLLVGKPRLGSVRERPRAVVP
jgi:hypothetical protein